MALTLLEAAKRTPSLLFEGIARSIVNTDEMAAKLPFRTFPGLTINYMREGLAPDTGFIPDSAVMGSPSEATYDTVSVPVRRIASDLDIDAFADKIDGGVNMGAQINAKAKATWNLVKDRIANGTNVTSYALGSTTGPFVAVDAIAAGPFMDTNRHGPGELQYTHSTTSWSYRAPGDPVFGPPVVATTDGQYVLTGNNASKYITVTLDVSDATANGRTSLEFGSTTYEFDGLKKIVSPDMVLPAGGPNGDILNFSTLDEMITLEKVRNNRAFVMNGRMINRILNAQRALGGTTPVHMSLPGYSGQVLTYRGIPLLECDNIKNNEVKGTSSNLSSVYLASLDAEEGLFMGVPGTGHVALDVEGDPRNSIVMGFSIEEVGLLEGKDHRRTRVRWGGALALRSTRALVRAAGLSSTSP